MSDRPAEPDTDEIEITPEMMEAGGRVLGGFSTYFESEPYWAERVYRAMEKVRRGLSAPE